MNPEEAAHYARRWAMYVMTLGETVHALHVLNKAIDLFPSDWRLWHARGVYHMAMKNYREAREDLQEAFARGGGSHTRDMIERLPDDDDRPPPTFRGFPPGPPMPPETLR